MNYRAVMPNTATYEYPDFIEIESTRGCNLKCRMCHVSFMKEPVEYLDIDAIKDFDFLRGKTVSLGAVFEPCIHPQINRLIDILNKQQCKLVLITNGHNLHKKKIPALFDSELEAVTFSFDGISKETYELVRVGGHYERTLENISQFRNSYQGKSAIFSVNFTVLKCNLEEVPEAVRFWNDRDMDLLRFIATVIREDDAFLRENSMWENRERYFHLLDKSANYVVDHKTRISISSPYFEAESTKQKYRSYISGGAVKSGHSGARLPKLYPRHFQYGAGYGMTFPCKSPFVAARVIWDGTVMLCHNQNIGNLYADTFANLWNSRAANGLRERVLKSDKLCNKCDYFRLCVNSHYVDLEDRDNYFSGPMLEKRSVMRRALLAVKNAAKPIAKKTHRFLGRSL